MGGLDETTAARLETSRTYFLTQDTLSSAHDVLLQRNLKFFTESEAGKKPGQMYRHRNGRTVLGRIYLDLGKVAFFQCAISITPTWFGNAKPEAIEALQNTLKGLRHSANFVRLVERLADERLPPFFKDAESAESLISKASEPDNQVGSKRRHDEAFDAGPDQIHAQRDSRAIASDRQGFVLSNQIADYDPNDDILEQTPNSMLRGGTDYVGLTNSGTKGFSTLGFNEITDVRSQLDVDITELLSEPAAPTGLPYKLEREDVETALDETPFDILLVVPNAGEIMPYVVINIPVALARRIVKKRKPVFSIREETNH